MAGKEILINQLFAGRYLSEGSNIGHEVINLFEDDRGDRYLYVTPSGMVRGHDVEAVFFVRNVQARRVVEVIALGLGLSAVSEGEVRDIRYGGVELARIFRGNTYHGGKDVFSNNVTYKADEVLVPGGGRRVFIGVDDTFDIAGGEGSVRLDSLRKVVVPQGMRMYYSPENDPRAYAQLHGLISDHALWEPTGSTGKLVTDGSSSDMAPTFLELIGKEDDELVFSNMLAHYFDYNHAAFRRFAQDDRLLGIQDMEADFRIERETNNDVDLWIESPSHVIVIENKIKSGVNGLAGDGFSQLDKYRLRAEEYARDNGKAAHFYIFAPDYSGVDFSRHDPDGTYKIIRYSTVHGFFASNCAAYIADRYFPEFLRGLERHATTMPELNFRTMRSRFMRKIAEAR